MMRRTLPARRYYSRSQALPGTAPASETPHLINRHSLQFIWLAGRACQPESFTSTRRVSRWPASFRWAFLAAFVCGTIGCGPNTKCSLRGSVSFNGEPVNEGSIRLDPVNIPNAQRAASTIEAGQFEIPIADDMLAGAYRVTIYGLRSTGRQLKARENLSGGELGTVAETVQYIPQKYNRQTELTVELSAGENTEEFNLEK